MQTTLVAVGACLLGCGIGAIGTLRLAERDEDEHAVTTLSGPPTTVPGKSSTERLFGITVASERVTLHSEVEGPVERIPVAVGDVLPRGSDLISINVRTLRTEMQKARAEVLVAAAEESRAQDALAQAKESLSRLTTLGHVVSDEERENARYLVKGQQADVEMANELKNVGVAQLGQTQPAFEKRTIRAPFDIVVAEVLVQRGAVVPTWDAPRGIGWCRPPAEFDLRRPQMWRSACR